MPSKKYHTYYSEKEKVYAIQEIKKNIITLERDVTKIYQNLKIISRKIYYLYGVMIESSEFSSSESSSSEKAYTIEEPRESDSDNMPPIIIKRKIHNVDKKPGNKAKPRRNPTRTCKKIELAKLSNNG